VPLPSEARTESPQVSTLAHTPELEGLEMTVGFTKAGIAISTGLVLFSGVVSVVWCAVAAADRDSLTCDFLGNIINKYVANSHCLLMKGRPHGVH